MWQKGGKAHTVHEWFEPLEAFSDLRKDPFLLSGAPDGWWKPRIGKFSGGIDFISDFSNQRN
jgi:hypothetical protein